MENEWKSFYESIEEEIKPYNAPEPRGKSVQLNLFCDAANGTCLQTRRSTTNFIFFLNGAPITWYSKRQNIIESSAFGCEFVAARIAIEMNELVHYI